MQARGLAVVALAVLTPLVAGGRRASAETLPPFDLHRRTASAEWVAHGRLDARGKLIVDATLKGRAPAKQVGLTNGANAFTRLNRLEKRATSVEVVLYLRRSGGKWEIERGDDGAVGFLNNGVYLVREEENAIGGAALGRHPTMSREAFLRDARAAVAALDRRTRLLALPPSADRVNKIVAFWLGLEPASRWHHEGELAREFRPLSAVEARALVARMKAADVATRPLLLQLVRATARGKAVFDAVADLLDRRQPRAVRQAAIDALAHVDPNLAPGRLIPLLRADEAELRIVLLVLRWSDPSRPDPAVVGPLRKLTGDVRRLHRDDREALADESHVLADVLGHHAHPKSLPLLLEWTLSDNHETCEHAGAVLRVLTGHSPREDARRWGRWWEGARPLLGADYDLRSGAGRRRWYHAYRSADAATRRLLMRWWAFDPAPDEAALVREAGGEGGDVAKVVLAELWSHGRLAGATKGALVEKFLAVRLEEVSGRPVTRSRELRIVGGKSFPFPNTAWVRWRAAFAIGDEGGPKLDGSFNVSSLGDGAGPQSLGTMGGGAYPGAPEARATLEVWEVEPSGGRVVWKRAWKLGPVRLRDAK